MDPSTPIQSANIFKTVGKSTFSKIRQLTQFKGDNLKAREGIAPQSREMFVWARTCPTIQTSVKFGDFMELYLR